MAGQLATPTLTLADSETTYAHSAPRRNFWNINNVSIVKVFGQTAAAGALPLFRFVRKITVCPSLSLNNLALIALSLFLLHSSVIDRTMAVTAEAAVCAHGSARTRDKRSWTARRFSDVARHDFYVCLVLGPT